MYLFFSLDLYCFAWFECAIITATKLKTTGMIWNAKLLTDVKWWWYITYSCILFYRLSNHTKLKQKSSPNLLPGERFVFYLFSFSLLSPGKFITFTCSNFIFWNCIEYFIKKIPLWNVFKQAHECGCIRLRTISSYSILMYKFQLVSNCKTIMYILIS